MYVLYTDPVPETEEGGQDGSCDLQTCAYMCARVHAGVDGRTARAENHAKRSFAPSGTSTRR